MLECVACRRPIEPGEPMVIVITALPSRLSRVPLQRHIDGARGCWHWRCAPRSVRRYAAPITLFDPPDTAASFGVRRE
jgi:hypothetical protein